MTACVSALPASVQAVSSTVSALNLPISYYPLLSEGQSRSIVAGSDGNLWFTIDRTGMRGTYLGEVLAPVIGSIARITTDGIITEFPLPGSTYKYVDNSVDSVSFAITAGSDGNLWFTEAEANKIGKITPQGVITEYPLSDKEMQPRSITAGPDGNIWFMRSGKQGSMLASMTTTGTIIKEIPIPGYDYGQALTFGSDGNLWFRGADYYSIAKVTSDGIYSQFNTNGSPVSIIPESNNTLWIGSNGGSLSNITTDGVITSYPTPGEPAWELAKDADNNIWFKDTLTKDLKEIDPEGQSITVYPLSSSGNYLWFGDMVFGSDNNLWFTTDNNIGRIEVPVSSPSPTPQPVEIDTPTPTPSPNPTPDTENSGDNNADDGNNYNNGFNNNYNNEYNNGYNNNYNNGYNNNYNNGFNNGYNNGYVL